MSCPTCHDVAAALAKRGPWPEGSPQAALAIVRSILERPETADGNGWAGGGWASAGVHRRMLGDVGRTEAFRRAIEAVVRPGDVVIDVGAGTGILAAFAARAGAAEVHAVERSDMARVLGDVMQANGLAHVVRVHAGDARSTDLPPARVLISEWLGHVVFGDGMWPAVVAVRDRCLGPDGVMLPARVDLRLAPVENEELRAEGPGWWDRTQWGLDLRAVGDEESRHPEGRPWCVQRDSLLADDVSVLMLDCARDRGDADTFERDVSFVLTRDGTLDALAAWFWSELAPGVELDTGPDADDTHWHQFAMPVRPIAVRAGQRLDVRVALRGARGLELRVALDGKPVADARYW